MSPERYRRIREFLSKRQPDLTLCMDEVHKPHNISAIIRTCDAVGIHEIHAIWDKRSRLRRGTALGSHKWVRHREHDSFADAAQHFKSQGMQIVVAHLSDEAVDFRELDYTQPTAIVMGHEKYGASESTLGHADQHILIPMMGMVQSLNVSVAAALVLYEAQRQRQLAGLYEKAKLDEAICQELLFEGGHPILQKQCKRKGLPYPQIGSEGEVIADDKWWQIMQLTPKAIKEMEEQESIDEI